VNELLVETAGVGDISDREEVIRRPSSNLSNGYLFGRAEEVRLANSKNQLHLVRLPSLATESTLRL